MSSFVPGIKSTATTGRLYMVHGQSLCVVDDGSGLRVPVGTVDSDDWLYLGTADGEPCFARGLVAPEPPAGTQLVSLRQLFGALADEDFGVAGRALGLIAWDRDHRFCGRCGAATERSAEERVRTCIACTYGATASCMAACAAAFACGSRLPPANVSASAASAVIPRAASHARTASRAGTSAGAAGGGVLRKVVNTYTPRKTGEVRVARAVSDKTLPWPSRPNRFGSVSLTWRKRSP